MNEFSLLIRLWYRQNFRQLPWRETDAPYKIWLSEVVLQQTRVDQGLSYYVKLLEKYPQVHDLANADEQELLTVWQGLGYYSRARNLRKAAQQIVEDFNGVFPSDYQDMLQLKGVGEYTAAAIASFAFGKVYPVVDGNVYRVLSRVYNDDTPIDSTLGKKTFKAYAQSLIDEQYPAEFNQAIMELGALVCKPVNPSCTSCPLQDICLANRMGTQKLRPVKAKKVKVRHRYFHYAVPKDGGLQLEKRKSGIWKSMYQFPLLESAGKTEPMTTNEMFEQQFSCRVVRKIYEKKHLLTHQHIHVVFWEVDRQVKGDYISVDNWEAIEQYPLPRVIEEFLEKNDKLLEGKA